METWMAVAASLALAACHPTVASRDPTPASTPPSASAAAHTVDAPSPSPPLEDSTPRDELAGFRAECAALPATRPSDLVLRHALHFYRTPEALMRFALYDASTRCPVDEMPGHMRGSYRPRVCVPLTSTDLDALYATLRAHHVAALRVRAATPMPHSAGASMTFVWDGNECTVGDVLHVLEMHPDDQAAFRAMDEAVRVRERGGA